MAPKPKPTLDRKYLRTLKYIGEEKKADGRCGWRVQFKGHGPHAGCTVDKDAMSISLKMSTCTLRPSGCN